MTQYLNHLSISRKPKTNLNSSYIILAVTFQKSLPKRPPDAAGAACPKAGAACPKDVVCCVAPKLDVGVGVPKPPPPPKPAVVPEPNVGLAPNIFGF